MVRPRPRVVANHDGEVDPISVQIAGADPAMMAQAARHNVDRGAQIIDNQYGLPGQENLQRDGGLGAAAGRTAGGTDSGGRSQCRARCAGHTQNTHRLGQAAQKCAQRSE